MNFKLLNLHIKIDTENQIMNDNLKEMKTTKKHFINYFDD